MRGNRENKCVVEDFSRALGIKESADGTVQNIYDREDAVDGTCRDSLYWLRRLSTGVPPLTLRKGLVD